MKLAAPALAPAVHRHPRLRSVGRRIALALVLVTAFVGFIALGVWQIERRAWKLDLIERVDSRINAPPTPVPTPALWPRVTAARDEYRHVSLSGRYLHDKAVRVQAVTAVGAGFWLITPLRMANGSTVLINRGVVPPHWQPSAQRHDNALVTITGLLRISEPDGAFLRRNVPQTDRWYSRDVAAIAAARGLTRVAPYFVDADRAADGIGNTAQAPRGGLTVVQFRNNHLVYALTWFALALMTAVGAWRVTVEDHRRQRREESLIDAEGLDHRRA